MPGAHVIHDFAELFEIFDDFLGENVRIALIVGFLQAFVSEPGDLEAGFIAVVKEIKKLDSSPFLFPYLILFLNEEVAFFLPLL